MNLQAPNSPKVTVYIPTYNYAHYIAQAVESILRQTFVDWELVIINDGSTDNTRDVLARYQGHPKIRIIDQENKGLNATNNVALRLSNGRYVIRLDPDDFFDENTLHILANVLDTKPEVGLVYPDYYHVDPDGNVIELVRRKKIEEEVELLDLPAHGAGTMIRRECLLDLQGYAEEFRCQDGYDLWLRFIRSYKPYNVNLPLFYYRQHGESLTGQKKTILDTRRQIEKKLVDRFHNGERPRVLGIVPAVRNPTSPFSRPLVSLAGQPLLWHTLNEASQSEHLDRVVVSTDDPEVLDYAGRFSGVSVLQRPEELTSHTSRIEDTVRHALNELRRNEGYEPDAVCILYINTPLRRHYHIDKAIDTMVIFNVDSVISVEQDLSLFYVHRRLGLTPVIDAKRELRIERDALFRETGALFLTRTAVLLEGRLLGDRIGHITMLPEEGVRINSEFSFWLAQQVFEQRLNGPEASIRREREGLAGA